MEKILLPDETLPAFEYLDQLSSVTEDDLNVAINEWEKRNKGSDSENILQAEVINE